MGEAIIILLMMVPLTVLLFASMLAVRQGPWLMAWLRGNSFIFCLFLSAIALLISVEMLKLTPYPIGENMAEVHIEDAVDQFLVTVHVDEEESSSLLEGDSVKLTFRSLRFRGLLNTLMPDTLLGLESIDSRFFDFESQNLTRNVSVDGLQVSVPLFGSSLTSWSILERLKPGLEAIGIETGSFTVEYLPMQKDAIYTVRWEGYGFEVVAANLAAQRALQAEVPLASNK